MAQPSGTLGAKMFLSDGAIASTVDTEREFTALTWIEVGLIDNMGDFGRVFETVTFQELKDGRTYKLKGPYNDGAVQITVAQDLADDGQAALKDAADTASQDNYGFRIELGDASGSFGGPTTAFFRGLPMSFRTSIGAANAVQRATANIEVNSDIITLPTAELYDQFVTGGSLAAWALFHGSDAQAADPAISADSLALATGDAGTGVAADGSQAIGVTGYLLSAGTTIFEVRVKLSAITNVMLFVGFTDQKAALEAPIESAASADTITTNATDAVGFMFDTAMSTDHWWLVGVNNDVDETAQDAGSAPVAATYATLRIELNSSGDASFYIDGAAVGSAMTTACSTSATLYPTVIAAARSTATRIATADYAYVRQD